MCVMGWGGSYLWFEKIGSSCAYISLFIELHRTSKFQVSQVFSECITKRNKTDVLWEDIEGTAEGYRADSRRI